MTRFWRRFATIVSFSFLFTLLAAQKNDGWELKNNKDGVKVYFKKTADVHEIKLITSLHTSLSGIVQLLSEVEHYPLWGYKILESKLLKKVSDTEVYYYTKLDFPWPLNDRDIIMHTHLTQDPVTKKIITTSVAVPDYLPENKDVVRIQQANTRWTLLPGTGGWPYIEYYIYTNPGGNLPDWLINMAIDVGPRETIKAMRTLLQQEKYKKTKLAHIKE